MMGFYFDQDVGLSTNENHALKASAVDNYSVGEDIPLSIAFWLKHTIRFLDISKISPI
jgi:hypothetical protein